MNILGRPADRPRTPAEGHFGGAEGTRTPDPLHAMQVRYQLRHSPKY
jgi:integrase